MKIIIPLRMTGPFFPDAVKFNVDLLSQEYKYDSKHIMNLIDSCRNMTDVNNILHEFFGGELEVKI
jgi:hypothetical protein